MGPLHGEAPDPTATLKECISCLYVLVGHKSGQKQGRRSSPLLSMQGGVACSGNSSRGPQLIMEYRSGCYSKPQRYLEKEEVEYKDLLSSLLLHKFSFGSNLMTLRVCSNIGQCLTFDTGTCCHLLVVITLENHTTEFHK